MDYCNPNITPHYPDYHYAARIAQRFLRKGWKWKQHSGLYTYYLLHSPCGKLVCKISGEEKAGQPDGYPRFAAWATRQNSRYLPKFYQVRALRRYSLHLTIAEKLREIPKPVQDKIYDAAEFYNFRSANQLEKTLAAIYYSIKENDLSHLMGIQMRGLIDTLAEMRNELGNPSDLHLGNILLRDGTPVLSDPYAA